MPSPHYDSDTAEVLLCHGLTRSEGPAFAQIYERYFDRLFTRAFKILGDSQSAEDAVQETFTALWKYRRNIDIKNLGGYLNRALQNAAVKACQQRKTDHKFFDRLAHASNELLVSDPVIYKELQAKLLELINNLPADQKLIYSLSREQHFTNKQIAEQLQISVKTVEKKMTLSLKYLRTELLKAMALLLAANC